MQKYVFNRINSFKQLSGGNNFKAIKEVSDANLTGRVQLKIKRIDYLNNSKSN